MCAIFLFVQTMVCLPVLGIFNVCTAVDACDYTWGLEVFIIIIKNSLR